MQNIYPQLYNASVGHNVPSNDKDPVKLSYFNTIDGFKVLSISKNRHFGKGTVISNFTLNSFVIVY